MGKLFIQTMPSEEEVHATVNELSPVASGSIVYTNLLFMKAATENEIHVDEILGKYGLSSGRYMLLFVLRGAPEGLMPSELAHEVGVTQATISGLISNLEKNEWIARSVHPKDGRAFAIKLTAKGHDVLNEIFPQWQTLTENFWNRLSPEEMKQMNQMLVKLIK